VDIDEHPAVETLRDSLIDVQKAENILLNRLLGELSVYPFGSRRQERWISCGEIVEFPTSLGVKAGELADGAARCELLEERAVDK